LTFEVIAHVGDTGHRTPSDSRLNVSHGTDRRTDRETKAINELYPTLWRRG